MREQNESTPPERREPLLTVEGLRVAFDTPHGLAQAVNGVDFEIARGERIAVVGESGSGKTLTAMSIVGLLPNSAQVEGAVRLEGRNLLSLGEREMTRIRGGRVGLVLQDPVAALNPLRTVGSQIAEALRMDGRMGKAEANAQAVELLRQVDIGDPELRVRQHGYELSGGMAQRVTIAAAIGRRPDLLIADEPTASLDATTARGVLELLSGLSADRGMALLLITHDLGTVAEFADRVLVMYAGRIVESGPVADLFGHPRHPYTKGLLESVPGARGHARVEAIPGVVPDATEIPDGCAFQPRCYLSGGRPPCKAEVPPLAPCGDSRDQLSACHFRGEVTRSPIRPGDAEEASRRVADEPLLTVERLAKEFVLHRSLTRPERRVRAVDEASLTIRRGEVVALVGESGSGKSTTARMILALETPSEGRIEFAGADVTGPESRSRAVKRRLQVVFQNPGDSLDPRMRIGDIVSEPLSVHKLGDADSRRERVAELLGQVGLSPRYVDRYPHELSGGQRQRVAIARALSSRPDLIVCDEPVTALDVSVQAQVLNLLQDVQRDEGLAYLLIAHDLSVVRQIADRVAVMYLGQIVEIADARDFFANPRHPYSVALLSAMTTIAPAAERPAVTLTGTMPSVVDPPSGCRFHTRCWKARESCREQVPVRRALAPGHEAACHFPEGEATAASSAPPPTAAEPIDLSR